MKCQDFHALRRDAEFEREDTHEIWIWMLVEFGWSAPFNV